MSSFRSLENTELLIDGMIDFLAVCELQSYYTWLMFHTWLFKLLKCITFLLFSLLGLSEDLHDLVSFGLDLFDDSSDREILFEVLRCVINISQQLGKTASFIFYESFVGRQIISSKDIIARLVKILENGYGSSTRIGLLSGLGADVAWEREQTDHKNLRKFSVDMLLSLHNLCKKAASWKRVLDVIESYIQFLVPQKFTHNSGAETLFCLNNSILVQASCQIAKVMFESALDILLFLSYLMNIGGQVSYFFLGSL